MSEPLVIPSFIAFTLGMAVYFIGAALTRRTKFLRDYNIPEPVSGGLLVAVIIWVLYLFSGSEIGFDLETRDTLLVVFFATIGLNARLDDLIRGGKPLLILLAVTVGFMILQNLVGLIGVKLFGLPAATSVSEETVGPGGASCMSLFVVGATGVRSPTP